MHFLRFPVVLCLKFVFIITCTTLALEVTIPKNFIVLTDFITVQRLAVFEENLAKELSANFSKAGENFNSSRSECVYVVKKYLQKYQKDNEPIRQLNGILKGEAVIKNVLLVYKMYKRLINLEESGDALEECEGRNKPVNVWNNIQQKALEANLIWPTAEDDLKLVLNNILQIHYIYGFNATGQLRLGIFSKVDTGVKLDFEECFELALEAISLKVYALAYDWLEAAVKSVKTSTDKAMLDKAWRQLMFKAKVSEFEHLQAFLHGKRQMNFPDLEKYSFYAGCRGEIKKDIKIPTDQRCHYVHNRNPFNKISPMKAEILSQDPFIVQYYDFLEKQEINDLKFITDKNAKQKEQNYGAIKFDNYGLFYYKLDSGLEIRALQTLLYTGLHNHDSIHSSSNSYYQDEGEMMAQGVLYLSDVTMGGYKMFPLLELNVKPLKGSALVWHYDHITGQTNQQLYSLECPVILGTKQVIITGFYQK